MQRCSVVTFDQAEEVLDTALVDLERVDVPEVVIEEDLDGVRILTQLGGDLRPASGYLSNLLGLLLEPTSTSKVVTCTFRSSPPHPAVRLPRH